MSVAGVGEPSKSVNKRVSRLAQKWFASPSACNVRAALRDCVCRASCWCRAVSRAFRSRASSRYASSDKVFATGARGFDQIADGIQRQLQAYA